MENWDWSLLVWSSICLSAALFLLLRIYRQKSKKLPPGPRGWPIVGNLFDFGKIPHQTLATLRPKYGPVMFLQLGVVKTVVIQSAEAAKEMFKNHDLCFAGRTITESMRVCNYYQGSLAVAQYGPYWRMLRRLCTTELFVTKRINETAILRTERVEDMIRRIDEVKGETGGVHIAHFVFLLTFNLLGNLIFSRDLLDPQFKKGSEFFAAMEGIMKLSGEPNLADFFPWLRWLDPQGIRKKTQHNMRRAMNIISGFMEERVQNRRLGEENRRNDLLDVLLEFEGDGKEEPANISDRNMVTLILEMFLAGAETTSNTIEWAMTELLRNPKSMSKVCAELMQIVGLNKKVEESNIGDLQYLQAVVKETLRLHPPLPFLVPRRVVKDNSFMGYLISNDTQVLVNAWAIGRDPNSWQDPLSFKPERFLDSDIDYRGHNFEFIPFGAGRRICAGLPLAHRVIHLTLGSLIYYFDWGLVRDERSDTIDMKERLGITLRKDVPLKAVPKKRVMS